MPSGDRTNEGVPSRRAEPSRDLEKASARSGTAAASARVWALGFLVILLAATVCGLWVIYLFRGRAAPRGPTPTAIIWTATPLPTPTATLRSTPMGDISGEDEETSEPTPSPSSGIAIGRYVQVTGTGGYGLSLRRGPGENYSRMDVAREEEIFIVVAGPELVGGSPWWRIRDPENQSRGWWAIGNYLRPVENP